MHELADAVDREALELALLEFGEEPLGEVQPRRRGGHEVDADAGVPVQPSLYLGMPVRRVVVEDVPRPRVIAATLP